MFYNSHNKNLKEITYAKSIPIICQIIYTFIILIIRWKCPFENRNRNGNINMPLKNNIDVNNNLNEDNIDIIMKKNL